jgi:hypothetical protein
MLQLKPGPRASGRHGRNLKWLTLKEIRASYLKGEALIKDGWPVGYFIEKMQRALSHEQITYETSKKKHRDRWEFLHFTKEIKTVISKAEAEVVDLMIAQAGSGRLVLAGRTHPDGVEEIIPRRLWAFLHLDVENGVACGLRKGVDITFRDLRGVFWQHIPGGDPIIERIRIAETPPHAPVPSANGAEAHKIEALASPDPDQTRKEEAECSSLAPDIETPESTKKSKRRKGSATLDLHIEDWKSRVRARQEKGEPEPQNASEVRALCKIFIKKYRDKYPLSESRLRNWLGSPEGKSMLKQLKGLPE